MKIIYIPICFILFTYACSYTPHKEQTNTLKTGDHLDFAHNHLFGVIQENNYIVHLGIHQVPVHEDSTDIMIKLHYGDSVHVIGKRYKPDGTYSGYIIAVNDSVMGYIPSSKIVCCQSYSTISTESENTSSGYKNVSGKEVHTGKRGGKYTISPSGKKQYIKKK